MSCGAWLECGTDVRPAGGPEKGGGIQRAGFPGPIIVPRDALFRAGPRFGLRDRDTCGHETDRILISLGIYILNSIHSLMFSSKTITNDGEQGEVC